MTVAQLEVVPRRRFTEATVSKMQEFAVSGKRNWAIIMLATKITQNVPERAWCGEVDAIHEWVKRNIKYVHDADNTEVVQHPLVTLAERKAGDCDDLAVAEAALLGAIGYRTAIRTIKSDPMRPDEFSHVHLVALCPPSPGEGWNGGWVGLDATVKEKPAGWMPKNFPSKIWMNENG